MKMANLLCVSSTTLQPSDIAPMRYYNETPRVYGLNRLMSYWIETEACTRRDFENRVQYDQTRCVRVSYWLAVISTILNQALVRGMWKSIYSDQWQERTMLEVDNYVGYFSCFSCFRCHILRRFLQELMTGVSTWVSSVHQWSTFRIQASRH